MATPGDSAAAPPPPAPATYPAQYSASIAPAPMRFPPWIDIPLSVMGIGTLLIFVGSLFGAAAAGQFNGGSIATFSGDLEVFFVLLGVGVLLLVGGWMMRLILPQIRPGRTR
jgi:hypothetical protein